MGLRGYPLKPCYGCYERYIDLKILILKNLLHVTNAHPFIA